MSKTGNSRRYPEAKSPRPDHYALRVKEAEARNTAWASLSPKDQLIELNRRHGPGNGASHQRARLQSILSSPVRADSGPAGKPEPSTKAATKEKAKDRHRSPPH